MSVHEKDFQMEKIMVATKRAAEGESDQGSRSKTPRLDIHLTTIKPRQSSFGALGSAGGVWSVLRVIAVPTTQTAPACITSSTGKVQTSRGTEDTKKRRVCYSCLPLPSPAPNTPAQSFQLRLDETTGEFNNTRDQASPVCCLCLGAQLTHWGRKAGICLTILDFNGRHEP